MTSTELQAALDNAALDAEIAELKKQYPPTTECVLIGPMGQTDIVPLGNLQSYASDHYDLWDYIELHCCTLADYLKTAEEYHAPHNKSAPV